SVTIPHKEAAANMATIKTPAVSMTRAANTLVRNEQGFIAYNTDFQAVLDSLLAHLPRAAEGMPPTTLHSKAALILGAGGVARAVAWALQREGSLVTISNRTTERARKLAEEVGCRYIDWEAGPAVTADLVMNCTSVGMHPNLDESPLHPS